MNLDENRFNFGVYFSNGDHSDDMISVPPGIGRLVSYVQQDLVTEDPTMFDLVNCTNLFPYVNLEKTEKTKLAQASGYCLDQASSYIEGVSTFG